MPLVVLVVIYRPLRKLPAGRVDGVCCASRVLLSEVQADFTGGRFCWNEYFEGELGDGKRILGEKVEKRRYPEEEFPGSFRKPGDCLIFHNKRGCHGVEEVLKAGTTGESVSRKTASLSAIAEIDS